MSSHEFKRVSDIPFAPEGQQGEALKFVYSGRGDLKIEVEAATREEARFIGTDIAETLEMGFPAAQTRILQHIHTAEAMGQPLACTLSY